MIATPKRSLICSIATGLVLTFSAAPPALADETNTIGITARDNTRSYAPGTLAMRWGIKQSFINYTGGFTHVLDGAQADGTWALWPASSPASVDSDGTVTAQFGGTVNFLKYCDNGEVPKRGECKLDFTGFDPKIVYNTVTNTGELYLTVHDYVLTNGISGPGKWFGPKMIKFATLDGANAKYNVDNGTATFEQVGVFLTKEGAETLPTYNEGLRIDDVSFSYAADAVKVGNEDTGLTVDSSQTTLLYDGDPAAFHTTDGHVVITSVHEVDGEDKNYAVIVDDQGAVVTKPQDFDTNNSTPIIHSNAAGDTLYWRSANTCSLNSAAVSSAGIGGTNTLFTLPDTECGDKVMSGLIVDIAPDPSNNTIGVISMTDTEDNGHVWTFRVLSSTGKEITRVALPSSHELFGTAESSEQYLEPYGSAFAFGSNYSLHALGDGTFISVYDREIEKEDGSKSGGVPVHIDPNAAKPATVIDAMSEQFYDGSHSYRYASVGDGLVVIYNNSYGNHPNFQNPEDKLPLRTGVYRYANGTFTKLALSYLGNDWDRLANIEIVDPNTLFIVSANESPKGAYYDAASLTVQEPVVKLSDLKGVQNEATPTLARAGKSFIQIGKYEKDYVDYIVINRIHTMEPGGRTPTESVEPVRLSGEASPAATTTPPASEQPSSTSQQSVTTSGTPQSTTVVPAPADSTTPPTATTTTTTPKVVVWSGEPKTKQPTASSSVFDLLPYAGGLLAVIVLQLAAVWGLILAVAPHNVPAPR